MDADEGEVGTKQERERRENSKNTNQRRQLTSATDDERQTISIFTKAQLYIKKAPREIRSKGKNDNSKKDSCRRLVLCEKRAGILVDFGSV